jgi:hypothetical protein
MNKEDVTLSLKSFIRMKKQQCEMEGVEFGEDEALAAVTPVLESLLYTVSSGGKMEEEDDGSEPTKPVSADLRALLVEAVNINANWDDDAAVDLIQDMIDLANREGLIPTRKPAKGKTLPTNSVDQFLNALGNP